MTTPVSADSDLSPDPGEDHCSAPLVEQDVLVEDVSIDGMCGVY